MAGDDHQNDTHAAIARASTFEAIFRRRIAEVTHIDAARVIDKDPSTITRFISGQSGGGLTLHDVGKLIDWLDLKTIHSTADVVSMPAEEAQALRVLAKKGLFR